MKMNIQNLLKSTADDGAFLFNDKQRAIKNHRLMQWAKVATFGLYIVAVFMLYVSDIWGIGSFIEKNSNEYVALGVFSFISFVLAYFLASSKEAVYEDIAHHRAEGWKLTLPQYAAMALFLNSGILFEMFSTTNNQQHIANTAAEQSTMMKSIQGTDVSVLGSSGLTGDLQKAKVRLATCRKKEAEMLAKGKKFDCVESQANLDAVKESMAMSNQLAQDASDKAMTNKVEGMLKVREHFDKPMFQAIGKATGTDNNSGMLMVIGVLIFIFECQHIMALFAYANALRRIKRDGGNAKQPASNAYQQTFTSPAPSSNPVTPFQAMKQEFKSMVDSSPEVIANEYARAQHARQDFYSKSADKLNSIQDGLNKAKADLTDETVLFESDSGKQTPEQRGFVLSEYERRTGKTYRDELRNGEAVYSDSPLDKPRPTPRLSVADTVKQIQRDVKASGATSPEAIQAAVFDSFAAMPSPAPLNDVALNKIADKLVINAVHTHSPAVSRNAQETVSKTVLDTVPARSETVADTVPARSQNGYGETVQNGLEGEAKQVESDLYPEWVGRVSTGEISPGARDAKRFISQRTKSKEDKIGLTVQEMGRIWTLWNERAVQEGFLKPNPDWSNGKPKYILA